VAESGPARRIKQEIDAEIGVVEQHEELLQLPDRRRTHFERHHFADEHVQPHHVTGHVEHDEHSGNEQQHFSDAVLDAE